MFVPARFASRNRAGFWVDFVAQFNRAGSPHTWSRLHHQEEFCEV